MDEFLEDYNQVNTAQMRLVLFMDAVRHVCRIGRIIRQPLGNALLLGMGGECLLRTRYYYKFITTQYCDNIQCICHYNPRTVFSFIFIFTIIIVIIKIGLRYYCFIIVIPFIKIFFP